jgi:hypothetical protein
MMVWRMDKEFGFNGSLVLGEKKIEGPGKARERITTTIEADPRSDDLIISIITETTCGVASRAVLEKYAIDGRELVITAKRRGRKLDGTQESQREAAFVAAAH